MAALRAVLILPVFLAALVAVPLSRIAPRIAASIIQCACRALLALLGVRVRVEGVPGTGLLIANHVSWLDAMLVLSTQPVSFLAKSEVGAWPLIASLAGSLGTIFVDRRRHRGIPAVNDAMAARLASGRTVLLFPEGTTHDGRRRGRFHTSHLACIRSLFARAPAVLCAEVQPVALAYSDPVAAWLGDDSLLPHVWRVLQRPRITGHLRFGASITVGRGYDRKALGRALSGEVEALLSREALADSDAIPAPSEVLGASQRAPRRPGLDRACGVTSDASASAEPSCARGQDAIMTSP